MSEKRVCCCLKEEIKDNLDKSNREKLLKEYRSIKAAEKLQKQKEWW